MNDKVKLLIGVNIVALVIVIGYFWFTLNNLSPPGLEGNSNAPYIEATATPEP